LSEHDEIVEAFLEESRENLAQLDIDLVALEANPSDPELLARIFRTIHTIKGTCGFLGYTNLEALTHAGESLLGALRDGDLALDATITTALLRLVDAVRAVLDRIDATGVEGDDTHAELIRDLAALHDRGPDRAPPPSVQPAAPAQEPAPHAPEAAAATESSVRIDVAVLDNLMNLVGELVLVRGRLAELDGGGADGDLAAPHRQLRMVTEDLQGAVMQARLQPIGIVLNRLPRIVRDLAGALEKRVRLEIEGEDVGVDKAVNEALRDPLLHLARNAIDHGIEPPAERVAAGKPEEGLLHIRAYHESGMVHVEVSDDGRGIEPDKLRARAVEAGIVDANADLSEREVFDLMFHPGLSTKSTVTNVSGRGVGMDVVRSNVQHIGGSVEVRSEPGVGTTFRLHVPLTLAIMPVLAVECAGERYAVPSIHVREVVRTDELSEVDGTRLHRLRDRLLPLAELSELFGRARSGEVIVVVELADRRFGLVVDAVGDTGDAVVKPLTRATRGIELFSAVTIPGDGRPSLILDLAGIADAAGIDPSTDEAEDEVTFELADADDLLVAIAPDGGRVALRLGDVGRLELLDDAAIERAGDVEVMQHDGALVPLLRVERLLPERRSQPRDSPDAPEGGARHAVVCGSSVGPVALVVAGIDDIAPEPATPPQPASRAGVEACLVIDGRIAELLDVEALVVAAGLVRRG